MCDLGKANHNKSRLLLLSAEMLKMPFGKQFRPISGRTCRRSLNWIQTDFPYTFSKIILVKYAADDLTRRHFQMIFAGTLSFYLYIYISSHHFTLYL